MKTSYRLIGAVMTWLSILLQYGVLFSEGRYDGLATMTIGYLSYFTILTNILVGLAFTAPLLSPNSKLHRFFTRQAVRAAIALYITVVMVVYWSLLSGLDRNAGLGVVTNILLHLLIPLMYLIDWLCFAQKDRMSFRHIPYWIIYPLLYGIYTIIRGAITGTYPYPFLNVTELGGWSVFVNMLGFTAFYAVGSAGFIALGRRLGKTKVAAEG